MANFTVLRHVNEALKKILKEGISELSDENSITFDSPAEIESTISPRLSVFLYQILENTYLRNAEAIPVGTTQMQSPYLVVDLLYLFTPYAQDRETEIMILEKLMQIFYDKSVLREDQLKKSGNEEIRIIPNSLSLEELNKLWGIFPNKPFKLSVSYMLTPVRIVLEKIYSISRVTEKEIKLYFIEGKK